jgi:hypothetical protein
MIAPRFDPSIGVTVETIIPVVSLERAKHVGQAAAVPDMSLLFRAPAPAGTRPNSRN